MAVQTWEEILAAAQLSADERKLIDNIVQKVPEFKDGRSTPRRLQSQDPQSSQPQRKKPTKAVEYSEKMKAWADEKVPIWESLVEAGVIDEESKPSVAGREKATRRKILRKPRKRHYGRRHGPGRTRQAREGKLWRIRE